MVSASTQRCGRRNRRADGCRTWRPPASRLLAIRHTCDFGIPLTPSVVIRPSTRLFNTPRTCDSGLTAAGAPVHMLVASHALGRTASRGDLRAHELFCEDLEHLAHQIDSTLGQHLAKPRQTVDVVVGHCLLLGLGLGLPSRMEQWPPLCQASGPSCITTGDVSWPGSNLSC